MTAVLQLQHLAKGYKVNFVTFGQCGVCTLHWIDTQYWSSSCTASHCEGKI